MTLGPPSSLSVDHVVTNDGVMTSLLSWDNTGVTIGNDVLQTCEDVITVLDIWDQGQLIQSLNMSLDQTRYCVHYPMIAAGQ